MTCPMRQFNIGGLKVAREVIIHPGPTVGYRISDGRATVAYLPDHEPALVDLERRGADE